MIPSQIIILTIFGIVAVAHLYGQFLRIKGKNKHGKIIEYITKPLMMPLLVLFYIFSPILLNWWYIAGLLGGFLGDVFLMLPDPSGKKPWFIFGLIAFLLGHIFYIVAMVQLGWDYGGFQWWNLLIGSSFIIYGIIIGLLLLKHCGKLKIPVLAYLTVIVLMGTSTTLLIGVKEITGVILLIVGAWLFVISDTCIAFNKFVKPIPNERLITMSTYIVGQLLMIIGYIYAV